MAAELTADIEGQPFTVDLTQINALDAHLYRAFVGETIDARVAVLMASAPEDSADWALADRGLIKWLSLRQTNPAEADFVAVLSSVTLLPHTPPAPDGVGGVDAPEAT